MDKTSIGYTHNLFILPFDHRGSFEKLMFGEEKQTLTAEELDIIKDGKAVIYEAFKQSLQTISQEDAAILVDEQFGDAIIQDALSHTYTVILTIEKSGQEVFDFEYGDAFAEHIEKYNPPFIKALIRYNPEGNEEENKIQRERLKKLSDYAHSHTHKLLLEPLIPATEAQLSRVGGDQNKYDTEIRPLETIKMIKALQEAGIEVDVWKIEGLTTSHDYEMVVSQAREGGRKDVGVVILGRNATQQHVETWLAAGAKVPGVIGFAVGRTIFWEPLTQYKEKKISREETQNAICKNFLYYYNFFKQQKGL